MRAIQAFVSHLEAAHLGPWSIRKHQTALPPYSLNELYQAPPFTVLPLRWLIMAERSTGRMSEVLLQYVQKYKDSLAAVRQSMQKEPKTMEDLKGVLRAIALVQDSVMAKEISFCDLEERFRCAA